MALSSINTNIAAFSAQRNIGIASDSASASIARLSSGSRIVQASDDVAALATGTSLRTSVTTLRQALLNTSQGSSLLQIADGALGQVVDILQRQKALSVQAGSGSLSDTDRAFLNQEFQALSDEIDRIATSTRFSSVNLLNGNLSGSRTLTTNAEDSAAAQLTSGNAITIAGTPADGGTITVNGVTITFTTAAAGSPLAAGRVTIGAAAAQTASNLVRFLNESTDARLANFSFNVNAANVTASYSGGQLFGALVLDVGAGTATNVTIGTAANRTIAAGSANGLGVDRTVARGSVTGTLLLNGGTTATQAGQAINTRAVEDNELFVGRIGEGNIGTIQGQFVNATTQIFSLQVGNITYTSGTAGSTNLVNAANQTLTFTGRDEFGVVRGGTFDLVIQGGVVAAADVANQTRVDEIAAQFNESLSGVTFTQNRDIVDFQEGATILNPSGVQIGTFNNASINFRSDDFSSVRFEDIQISAPEVGSSDARITARINGETYISFSGIGTQIGINSQISLQNIDDPTRGITIVTGNTPIAGSTTVALDLSTQANADAIEAAFRSSLGIEEGSAALTFQVGSNSAESLGVRIDSVETDNIYSGATLDISTQIGASAAGEVVDAAINRVISIRADVGALQSRFDFASSNLQVSIQNQEAARGVLLDTDVTAESTAYATAQVQLQAGIAVLAQANLLPQNLLKLIG